MNIKTFIIGHSDPTKNLPGCVNFDRDHEECFDGPCKVLNGERCGYFERAVLPTAKESGRYDILDFYSSISIVKVKGKERVCVDCGTSVVGRNKRCPKCKIKRNREYQKNFRRNNFDRPKNFEK
jgi:hypothetical protein